MFLGFRKILFGHFFERIPFIQCLVVFPWASHKAAFPKFVILLIISTSPVILAALLSPIPPGEHAVSDKLFSRLESSISVSELFIYAASFLAPTLFLIFERYRDLEGNDPVDKFSEAAKVYKGYIWVFFFSAFILLLTASAFSVIKTNNPFFQSTFLHYILSSGATYIYLFSLYSWYLSIVQSVGPRGNYIRATRAEEANLAKSFKTRIKNREANNE